jgi:hypothetical protein
MFEPMPNNAVNGVGTRVCKGILGAENIDTSCGAKNIQDLMCHAYNLDAFQMYCLLGISEGMRDEILYFRNCMMEENTKIIRNRNQD